MKNSLVESPHVVVYSDDVPRTLAGLLDLSTSLGLSLAEMTVRSATLEDVFLKLTGRRIRQ